MTAIVLPDIDKSTLDELRRRIPDLSEIELPAVPSMEKVGKRADETIDKLLGRSRAPVWPWVALGVAIVSTIAGVAAYMTWFRRSPWSTSTEEPWTAASSPAAGTGDVSSEPWSNTNATDGSAAGTTSAGSTGYGGTGLTAAESSLVSGTQPGEGA